KRETGDVEGGRRSLVAELEVPAYHLDVLHHLPEVAGDGDLLHGIREFAAFDPESHGAARVIAGREVDAEPYELRDVESPVNGPHDLLRCPRSRLEIEIRVPYRHPAPALAGGVPRRCEPEPPRAVRIQEVVREDATVHQHGPAAWQPLSVEWPRPQPLRHQGIVDDRDAR